MQIGDLSGFFFLVDIVQEDSSIDLFELRDIRHDLLQFFDSCVSRHSGESTYIIKYLQNVNIWYYTYSIRNLELDEFFQDHSAGGHFGGRRVLIAHYDRAGTLFVPEEIAFYLQEKDGKVNFAEEGLEVSAVF